MTVYASLPLELLHEDLNKIWSVLHCKLIKLFPDAKITSNFVGDNMLSADCVIFLYDYKDSPSCQCDFEQCLQLDKNFNFLMKIYTPEGVGMYLDTFQ